MTGLPRRPSGGPSDRLSDRFFGSSDRSSNLLLFGVIGAAIVVILWVLFLPPFSLLRGSSEQSAGEGYSVKVVNTVPSLPPGLAPASRYYQIGVQRNASGAVNISLPLLEPKTANRG